MTGDGDPGSDGLRQRIADQFSDREARGDVWRGFELFLDTGEFLNLGYSRWYQPHFLGSSQRRLAAKIGSGLADRLDRTAGVPLLDVGCGRGGPTIHLARAHGFAATGIDLVPYNVELARSNAVDRSVDASFLVADAMHLPFEAGSFPACVAIDAPVYFDDRQAFFAELSTVVEPGGIVVLSDLIVADDGDEAATSDPIEAFASAWDFAPLEPLDRYSDRLNEAGFDVEGVADISRNSVTRFRKWAGLFLALRRSPLGRLLDRLLGRSGIDAEAATEQIRAAFDALPHLRHVIVYARREDAT